jgi:hypothetical protein
VSSDPADRRRELRARGFLPLAGFAIPTIVIGYGLVISRSCIAAANELTLGFASTIAGACVTYWIGLRALAREKATRR